MKRTIITISLLALSVSLTRAQEFEPKYMPQGEKMTLRECIEIGLESNYHIRVISNNEEIASNNATRGNAGMLPSADLSAGYSGTLNNNHYDYSGSGSQTDKNVHNYGLNAGLGVNWTLFDGFSIRTTYQKLKEYESLGKLNTRMAIEDYLYELSLEYYGYIRQLIRLDNLQSAVKLSMERVRIVEAEYSLGTSSRLDLQQARVDLNTDRSLLMQQFETIHAVRTSLNELMAMPDIDFPLMPADSTIEYKEDFDKLVFLESMMSDNVFLEISRKNVDLGELEYKIIRSGRYPYIRLSTGYGYSQNWYGNGTYNSQRNLGLNYGFTVGFNLFDGHNQRRREANTRLENNNLRLEYEQMELSLTKGFSDAWMAHQNNLRLISLEADNLVTAKDLYEGAMDRYKFQQLSGFELREAQNRLLEAEERLIQAKYETKKSELQLILLSGKIVPYLI